MVRSGAGRAGIAARVRDLLRDPDDDEFDDHDSGVDGNGAGWDDADGDGGDDADGDGGRSGPARGGGARAWRWRSSARATTALGAIAVLAAVVTGIWVWSSRPDSTSVGSASGAVTGAGATASGSASIVVPGPGDASGAGAASGAGRSAAGAPSSGAGTATASGAVLVVDVAGKVRHPGVYRLPTGSRVYQALDAAGGALPGVSLTSLNLAATLSDGQQIVVGVAGTTGAAGVPGAGATGGTAGGAGATGGTPGTPGTPVDLNTADLTALETLPGIGPALGQRILDWRTQHGRFTSVQQLNDVSGIGDVKFGQLRDLVTV